MTRPRRAIDTPEPTPQRGRSALLVASLAVLSVGGVWAAATLPASADTHDTPEPEPVIIAAEAGPGCGGVTVGVTGGDFLEWYRADLDTATANPTWVRQSPMDRTEFSTYQMVDSPYVQYRVTWATGEDTSPVIEVEPCPEPSETTTPTPTVTPSATPTPRPTPTAPGTSAPTGAATASPGSGADGKTVTGGLASTGV